jgi:hypothetical protein
MCRNDSCNFPFQETLRVNISHQLQKERLKMWQKISTKGWGYHDRYGGLP